MCENTITEIINELSRLRIEDSHLAWQLKSLLDRLCLLEGIYDNLPYQSCLSETERGRYVDEVFPSILTQCRKMADYFSLCPELRTTKEDLNVLSIHFQRYVKIVDRLLAKLQNARSSKRISIIAKMRGFCTKVVSNVKRVHDMFGEWLQCKVFLFIPLILGYGGKKTVVTYHRDSIDYVGSGYSLQLISPLSFECA